MIIDRKSAAFCARPPIPSDARAGVQEQINYVNPKAPFPGPKKALILGSSTGYGFPPASQPPSQRRRHLGARLRASLGKGRTASPGWYQTQAFERAAHKDGLWAKSLNGDAFSEDMKAQALVLLKEMGPVDLVFYSLAAPRRTDPKTGEVYKSVLKPSANPIRTRPWTSTTAP